MNSKVAEFSVMLGVVTAIGASYTKMYGQSEEDKEAELRRKFPDLVRKSEQGNVNMQVFFDSMKNDPNDPENQKKFDALLRGGRQETKNQGANTSVKDLKKVENPAVIPLKKKEKMKKKKDEAEVKKGGWLW